MSTLKSFSRIVDSQTLAVTVLALLSTWACLHWGFEAELPSALIGIAVIFPIVFSINSAYKRREEALSYLADAKGHAMAIAWAHRDWTGRDEASERRGRELVVALFTAMRSYFQSGRGGDPDHRDTIYGLFSQLSESHEALRDAGVPGNEVSRINQYLRAVLIDFEKMRNILEYRTPQALRAYSRVFLNSFPVLYGPYFASLANDSMPVVGYLVALIYSLVLVSLDNIQEGLENPYGTVDEDDVAVDLADEIRHLLDATSRSAKGAVPVVGASGGSGGQ